MLSGPIGGTQEKTNAYIYDQMAEEGIDASGLVRMEGLVTPISNIMIDPSGERTIVTYRDPKMWMVKLPPPEKLLVDCDAILTENRCAEFVTDVCAEAHRRGIPVVIDADRLMSLREGLLQVSSHIIFSAEALQATAGESDHVASLRKIAELTSAFLGVTFGAKGVTWLDERGEPRHMPAFPVQYRGYARRRRRRPRRLRPGRGRGSAAGAGAALRLGHGGAEMHPLRRRLRFPASH